MASELGLREALRAAPAGEPVWDSLEHVLPDTIMNVLVAETIAGRADAGIERDLAPGPLAAVPAVAVRTSVALSAEGHTDATLSDLIRGSIAQLRAGLPLGSAAPTA